MSVAVWIVAVTLMANSPIINSERVVYRAEKPCRVEAKEQTLTTGIQHDCIKLAVIDGPAPKKEGQP